jgi:L-aspartate oxidase
MNTIMNKHGVSLSSRHRARVDAPRQLLSSPAGQVYQHTANVLVVGGGVAGLMAALRAATHANVVLLTRAPLLESNSALAQGGIAAAMKHDDSPLLHRNDTLEAGAGLSDEAAVEMLVEQAPRLMQWLDQLGVPFDREDGRIALGLEGSHSRRRILHVGDATGLALTRTLATHVRDTPTIRVLEGYQVIDLVCRADRCLGVLALDRSGILHRFTAGATILATGGAGGLYGRTSNTPGALGEGVALAYRAGGEVADMEFVQFHPTVLQTRSGQGFLISEATRGEGGRLLTLGGNRFMPDYDSRAELAPRDIVTRGIFDTMRREGSDHVLLDLTHLPAAFLSQRFPTICARCLAEGIDPSVSPLPVAPAAHYLMGGIRTDLEGRTSIAGLYAAGECACTGVHGANRLASNSLLECLVMGERAADAALDGEPVAQQREEKPRWHFPSPSSAWCALLRPEWRAELAAVMRQCGGPLRSAEQLADGLHGLERFPLQACTLDPEAMTAANAALVARLILSGALVREESRGAHFRTDFPTAAERWRVHLVQHNGHPARPVESVAEEMAEQGATTETVLRDTGASHYVRLNA